MDEFMSFLLNPQHWLLVMGTCVIAVTLCFALRRSPWVIVLWLPSAILAGIYTGMLGLLFLKGIVGRGSDAGWYIFAGIMQTMVAFPIVISFILLLVLRPVKAAWHPRYFISAISAVVIASLALMFWFNTSKPKIHLLVTDEGGSPLAGVALRDSFDSTPKMVTDYTGVVSQSLPYGKLLACVFTADGYQEHHIVVEISGTNGGTLCVDHSWYEREPKIFNTTNERIFYSSKPPVTIPVIMKKYSRKAP